MQKKILSLVFFASICIGCYSQQKISLQQLKGKIDSILHLQKGDFAVAFKNLSNKEEIFINENELFHAASTMKTPVLVEIYNQVASGKFSLSDSIVLRNQFKSIADTSTFSLSPDDDSEFDLYKHLDEKRTISNLVYLMITVSSNFATNLLVDLVGAKNVMQTMHQIGANDIRVLRGVEDNKAYKKGMNNMVTAHDLLLIFEKMAEKKLVSASASEAMIKILMDQHFNEIIPAQLPSNVKVAHKTGWFKSVNHDSGIVFLPDGRKYVLVLLSKNAEDDKASVAALATISGMIYKYLIQESFP
jgi:beta-lactamase class A